MPSIFTRSRVAYYCTALLISAAVVQIFSVIRDRRFGDDFAVFYAEGKIALHYPHSQLYNVEIQDKEYSATVESQRSSPFPYAPWFTLPLALLARLSYVPAFFFWTLASVACLVVGFWLIARAVALPASYYYLGVLACLAFPPYLFYTLLNGQASAVAFFILSLSFFLHKKRLLFLSGLAISLLTYKPTLLLFVGPMLVVTGQWRILLGFIVGSAALFVVSLLWAGVEGCLGFLNLLSVYNQVLNSPVEVFQTEKYVDVTAATRLLMGPQPILRWVLLSVAFPLCFLVWYRAGQAPLSWSVAILCGLIFNLYSPIYDCTLLIFTVVLVGIDTLKTWLIGALYLVPAITVPAAKWSGIQMYTLILILFLSLLAYRALTRRTPTNRLTLS